jgi:hypothetical protein
MMLLRGYGNCICIPVAYEFVMAAIDAMGGAMSEENSVDSGRCEG